MQLLTSYSEEGDSQLLNLFPIKTLRFKDSPDYKVPHTGWNTIFPEKKIPYLKIFRRVHTFTLYIHTLLSMILHILYLQQITIHNFRHQFGGIIFTGYNFTPKNPANTVKPY